MRNMVTPGWRGERVRDLPMESSPMQRAVEVLRVATFKLKLQERRPKDELVGEEEEKS